MIKFISAKNIIILFISLDDSMCLIWGWKTGNVDYSLYVYGGGGKKNLYQFKFSGKSKED